MRAARNFHAGLAAEDSALRQYASAGYALLARRFRGTRGEIDLILQRDDDLVFVEVKKSRSFDSALLRISTAQIARIFATAGEFLDTRPDGSLTQTRFDVALVDAHGQVQILENALWQ